MMNETVRARLLQAYLRDHAGRTASAIPASLFTLFLYPAAPVAPAVAFPDRPEADDWDEALVALEATCARHGCRPRVSFVEACAPGLPAALTRAGFVEERRGELLVCTPATLRAVPERGDLRVVMVTADSSLDEIRENLDTNERGFNPDGATRATEADAAGFRTTLTAGRGFTARLGGEAVAAGLWEAPIGGVTELVGITTLAPFRRRGIATTLTAAMTRAAFAHGVTLAFLRTSDAGARRVYERVGFAPGGALLTFAGPTAPGGG
jgi:GNAT superfamily N-acetyltransferase